MRSKKGKTSVFARKVGGASHRLHTAHRIDANHSNIAMASRNTVSLAFILERALAEYESLEVLYRQIRLAQTELEATIDAIDALVSAPEERLANVSRGK